MPFSHQLPAIIKAHPNYDTLPSRLSKFVRSKYGYVKVADVGANIGDSIIAFRGHEDDKFLAIEANPRFIKYLKQNVGLLPGVIIVESFCADFVDDKMMFTIHEDKGTAEIIPGEGINLRATTLDRLIKEYDFSDLNIIKTDTDGHDLRVLRGAQAILRTLPAIFFEVYSWGPDCIDSWRNFFQSVQGYEDLILYDQTGMLMGKYNIRDFSSLADLLYYQAIVGSISFDALLMRPDHLQDFFVQEKIFFAPLTRPSPTAF